MVAQVVESADMGDQVGEPGGHDRIAEVAVGEIVRGGNDRNSEHPLGRRDRARETYHAILAEEVTVKPSDASQFAIAAASFGSGLKRDANSPGVSQ